MKKVAVLALALALPLSVSACGRSTAKPPQPAPPAAASATPYGPAAPPADPVTDQKPTELSPQALVPKLQASQLDQLYARWGLNPDDLTRADLDGDGTPETIAVLPAAPDSQSAAPDYTAGVLAVFHGTAVDYISQPMVRGAGLAGIRDLTGDGKPEIIWYWKDAGASTEFTTYLVASWTPGHLANLPGTISTSFAELELDGRDLVVHGGLVGSAGAGEAQRGSTDRYRWVAGEFKLVDRRFDASDYAYHRLQDGLVAEQYGRLDDAKAAYREAMEPDRKVLTGNFSPQLGGAVRDFARFRLGLLLRRQNAPAAAQVLAGATGLPGVLLGAGTPDEACTAAEAWAGAHPEFLGALNSPFGYGNPSWAPEDMCGPLPPNQD